jgi:hypothetical protein
MRGLVVVAISLIAPKAVVANDLVLKFEKGSIREVGYRGKTFMMPCPATIADSVLSQTLVTTEKRGSDPEQPNVEAILKGYEIEGNGYCAYYFRAARDEGYTLYRFIKNDNFKKRKVNKSKKVSYRRVGELLTDENRLESGETYRGERIKYIIEKNFPGAMFFSDKRIEFEYKGALHVIRASKESDIGVAKYRIEITRID